MIYLDHNATAAIRPEARDAMLAAMLDTGNASSIHAAGRKARSLVDDARAALAALVNVEARQVIFNSGATEGNNTVLQAFPDRRLLISAIEHPSVHEVRKDAEIIAVNASGVIELEALDRMLAVGDRPALVSVMLVNNETGVIQPVDDIVRIARKYGALVHCDAVQALGRVTLDFAELGVDYMTLSAHKMGGPQGIGALVSQVKATPVKLLWGGGQERRQRAGTENIAGIAGFGAAAKIAATDMDNYKRLGVWRDDMEARLIQAVPGVSLFGASARRVANTSCFALAGVAADTQLVALDLAGICASSGSACSSGSVKPSRVLAGMGVDESLATCALRISFGWNTTQAEVNSFIDTWTTLATRWTGILESR